MNDKQDIKSEIEDHIENARHLIPDELLDPLPPDESLGGVPAWRDFEGKIWALGEDIRQLLLKAPQLRADESLQNQIADIACDRRAHRGRQSFVMLLGYRSCAHHAERLAQHLDDPFVDGHVMGTLYKMRAHGHSRVVERLLNDKMAWVRNEARRYLVWDTSESSPSPSTEH